jgi:molybdopterin converting factor small subunit
MNVIVEYFGQTRAWAGLSREVLQIAAEATVAEVLVQLAEKYGGRLAHLLLDQEGRPSASILLALQDRQLAAGENPILTEGATLTLIPPVAGG